MSDIKGIGPAHAAQAVQVQAGRSLGSAKPQVLSPSQTPSQGEFHPFVEEVRREQLAQAEPPSGSIDRSTQRSEGHLQEAIAKFNRSVNFRVDEATGRSVVTIRDRVTGEVIREIPSREFLDLVVRLDEMRGFFFEEVV